MNRIDIIKLHEAHKKAIKGIITILPILLGLLLIISIVNVCLPQTYYSKLFTGNVVLDALKGGLLGSLLTGNPITGYILGSGFVSNGVSLVAVTAFIVAWTTVGLIQLPAESLVLGKSFAFYRNLTAFVMAIITAIISVLLLNWI